MAGNTACPKVAALLQKPGTGGSDAHSILGVGSCVTVFQYPVASEADLLDARRLYKVRKEANEAAGADADPQAAGMGAGVVAESWML